MGIPPSLRPRRASSMAVFSMARYFLRIFCFSLAISSGSRLLCSLKLLGNTGHWEQPAQDEVRRPVQQHDCCDKNHREVRRGGSPGAMKERILIDIVHVEAGGQKARGDQKSRGNRGLQCEGTMVVSNFAHGPEQGQWESEVKGRKQPDPDRYTRIPHVFGSADEKASGNEAPPNIGGPEESGRHWAARVAGNQQGTPPPQSRGSQRHRSTAQIQWL